MKKNNILKWAGGKSKLTKHIRKHYHKLSFKRYVELFFGGGANYFELVNNNSFYINNSIVNDMNTDLMKMYKHIKNSRKKLIEAHNDLIKVFDRQGYYYIRSKYNGINIQTKKEAEKYQGIERSAALMVLNKTCYNGLYRVNANGMFNVPEGKYEKPSFISEEEINIFHKILPPSKNIKNMSYEKIKIKKKDFVYIDPPYDPISNTSSFSSYVGDFNKTDQEKLKNKFDEFNKKGVYVILSNSNTAYIRNLYKNYKIIKIDASRNINSKAKQRQKIKELIILGKNINI